MQVSSDYSGMAPNLDISLILKLFCLPITCVIEIQAHPVAFEAPGRIIRFHIKDNHVPGVLGEAVQVQILMPFVLHSSCPDAHFLHHLANGFPHLTRPPRRLCLCRPQSESLPALWLQSADALPE